MKLPLLCFALLTWAGAAFGQDSAAPAQAPMPSGPLLKRAPDMSTWTVTAQNAAPPSQAQGQTSGGANPPRPLGFRQAVVTKTGKIIDEQLVDGVGRKFEIWHVNGIEVSAASDASAPLIVPNAAAKDIYTTNFATSDFAGLDWISPQTYAGIQKVMGRDCIIFRGTVNPMPADMQGEAKLASDRTALLAAKGIVYQALGNAPRGPGSAPSITAQTGPPSDVSAVACIDLDTRLPVAVTFGQETRTYAFGQPPTSMLELPVQFAAALGAYQRHIANLSRAPAAP